METQFTKEECGSGNIQTKQTEATFIVLLLLLLLLSHFSRVRLCATP